MRTGIALVLAAAAAALAATAAPAGTRAGQGGTLFEVTFSGKGEVTAIGSSPKTTAIGFNQSTVTANFTYKAEPTKLWIANVHDGSTVVTKASAATTGSGSVTANEQFTWYKHDDPKTPQLGTSVCKAAVKDAVAAAYTAESTKGGISITVDLTGAFRTDQGVQVPCQSQGERGPGQPVDGDYSYFAFGWNPDESPSTADPPPYNQKMQLGDTILPFQLGLPSVDLVLKNQSDVTTAGNCFNLDLTRCNVTFKLLDVELNLKRICTGLLGTDGQGACGGGGGGSTPKKNGPPPPPPNGPPKLTGLKVSPASFALSNGNVRVSYHDDQPGSTTLLRVMGSVLGHDVPVEVFTHVDAAKAVSLPLPRGQVATFPLKPGRYTLVAMPVGKTTGPGKPVTTSFVITP